MPRPARKLWVTRTYARRRHRHWMVSMTLASFGWGVWWIVLFLHRLAPGLVPSLAIVAVVSCSFALVGLAVAVLTVRARRAWLLFAAVPLLANASLFCLPWLADELWADVP